MRLERSEADRLLRDVELLERRLNELKQRYEQYFLGMEKLEPAKLRREVEQLIQRYSGVPIQNTGLKFRYDGLVARFNSFQNYWNRVLREIDEGHYKRDLFKHKIHAQERSAFLQKSAAPTTSAKKPEVLSQVFDRLIQAKQQTGESTEALSRERLAATLKQQTALIKKRYNCKRVAFKVVIEEGRAKVKATPKN